MWIFTDKQARKFIENWLSDNREEAIKLLDVKVWEVVVEKKEEPKPTKRKAIMSFTLINNITDKEYVIESTNDFGLTWEFFGTDKVNKYQLLQIRQKNSLDDNSKWTSAGIFSDFSIKSTEWKEFDIKYEDENKTETETETQKK